MAVNDERIDQTAPGVTRRGFAGRFLDAVQNRLFAGGDSSRRADHQEAVAPDARITASQYNQEVADLNAEILAASEENIELLRLEIYDTVEPAMASGDPLVAARSQAIDDLGAMREAMSRNETSADVTALRLKLTRLQASNEQLQGAQAQRAADEITPEHFRSNFTELYRARMYRTGQSGERGENPSWRENTLKARAVNNEFLIKSAWTLARLDAAIESKSRPSDERSRASLVVLRTDVSEIRESVEEMIAQHHDTKNAEAWGWTAAELAAQDQLVADLDEINRHLSVEARLRGIESRGAARQPATTPSPRRSASARNADASRGATPGHPAAGDTQSSARSAVMNPDHVVALNELDRGGADLDMGDSSYSR